MMKFNSLVIALVLLITPYQTSLAKEIQIKHAGLMLNGYVEIAEGKTLKNGVILMTHGTLAHGRMEIMTTLQELLKDNGVNSLSITLGLGLDKRRGMYDCNVPHTHKHRDALNEIDLWFKWLTGQGAKNISLLGHSRGGNQTAWYAVEHDKETIKSVILVAPMTWNKQKDINGYKKRYKKDLGSVLSKATSLVKSGKGSTLLKNTDFIYCPDTQVTATSFVDYYQPDTRFDTPGLLPMIKKPVLIFAGSEDKTVKDVAEKTRPFADKQGNVHLKVIEGSDHFFRDLYAEEVVDGIVDFISK